jgi:hypothetical protein
MLYLYGLRKIVQSDVTRFFDSLVALFLCYGKERGVVIHAINKKTTFSTVRELIKSSIFIGNAMFFYVIRRDIACLFNQ